MGTEIRTLAEPEIGGDPPIMMTQGESYPAAKLIVEINKPLRGISCLSPHYEMSWSELILCPLFRSLHTSAT